MTRKILTIIATVLLFAMIVTACSTGGATGDIKQGLGSVNRISKSKDAGEEDGLAQVDAVVAAVTLDSEGKILAVNIDTVQARVPFTAEGKLAIDPATLIKTKKELGDEYGMKGSSSLNKEWYEQIEALEKWLTGKTLSDIEGKADDLKTSVTITVTDYLEAVKKAIADAG